jgi:hypothetical protein
MDPISRLIIVGGKQVTRPVAMRCVKAAESHATLRHALLLIGTFSFRCRQFVARYEAAGEGGDAPPAAPAAAAATAVRPRKARKIDILGLIRRQEQHALPRPTDLQLINAGAKLIVEFTSLIFMFFIVWYEATVSSKATAEKARKTAERLVTLQGEVEALDRRVEVLSAAKAKGGAKAAKAAAPAPDAPAPAGPEGHHARTVIGQAKECANEAASLEAVFDERVQHLREVQLQEAGAASGAAASWLEGREIAGVDARAAVLLTVWTTTCAVIAGAAVGLVARK